MAGVRQNINGNTLADPTGADEKENLNGNLIYISRAPTKSDAASGEFDDMVVWISPNILLQPHGCCRQAAGFTQAGCLA